MKCEKHQFHWDISDPMGCPICHGEKLERERIIGIIDQFIENSDYPEVVSSLQWLQDVIKGENKTNLWTSRPLTEEDIEHYGLEGENK